jgi:hypothetical protein
MVDRLVVGAGSVVITSGKALPEVQTFQQAWNGSRDLVAGELNALVQENTGDQHFSPQAGSSTERAMNGLVADGIYGANTATALALTLWARLGAWENPNGIPSKILSIPTNPKDWPAVWAGDRAYWTRALSKVSSEAVMPPPEPSPHPADTHQVVTDAESGDVSAVLPGEEVSVGVELPPTAPKKASGKDPSSPLQTFGGDNGEIDFSDDEGSQIVGQTKGRDSSLGWLVLGAGLLLTGGIVAVTVSRKARRK